MPSKKKAAKAVEIPQPFEDNEEIFDEDGPNILSEISEMPDSDDDLDDVDEEDYDLEVREEEALFLAEDAQEKLDAIIEKKTEDFSSAAIIKEKTQDDYEPTQEYPTANHFINRVRATKNPNIVERSPQHNPFLILRDKK